MLPYKVKPLNPPVLPPKEEKKKKVKVVPSNSVKVESKSPKKTSHLRVWHPSALPRKIRPPHLQAFNHAKRALKGATSEEDVAMAQSLLDPGAIYVFRIADFGQLSTSVGGAIAFLKTNDPSAFAEWATLSALFSVCRLRQAEYRWNRGMTTQTSTTTGAWEPAGLNGVMDTNGTPSSMNSAIDTPNFKLWNYAFDTSPEGVRIHVRFNGDNVPLWADVSTPYSATLYEGCPGGSQIWVNNGPASLAVICMTTILTIEFQSRH